MNPSELKAVLAKTNEVAVYPANIEAQLPYTVTQKNRRGLLICPTGLKRAIVIQDGAKWIEKRPVSACGDQDYEIHRRNGVLVEFDYAETFANDERFTRNGGRIAGRSLVIGKGGNAKAYPHAEIVERKVGKRARKKFVRMIVSRKAIMAPWNEYEMIEAARERTHEESERRERALREPQAEIMGLSPYKFEKLYVRNTDNRAVYLGAEWRELYKYDDEGEYIYEDRLHVPTGRTRRERVVEREIGLIQLPLEQVEKILSILTPAQKKKLAS